MAARQKSRVHSCLTCGREYRPGTRKKIRRPCIEHLVEISSRSLTTPTVRQIHWRQQFRWSADAVTGLCGQQRGETWLDFGRWQITWRDGGRQHGHLLARSRAVCLYGGREYTTGPQRRRRQQRTLVTGCSAASRNCVRPQWRCRVNRQAAIDCSAVTDYIALVGSVLSLWDVTVDRLRPRPRGLRVVRGRDGMRRWSWVDGVPAFQHRLVFSRQQRTVAACSKDITIALPHALISSHLLFFKNSCQTQLCTKFIHTYRYNKMLWRQIVNNNNDIGSYIVGSQIKSRSEYQAIGPASENARRP